MTSSKNIFYHRGAQGDIIYSLPTIISIGGGILVLRKDHHYNFLKSLLEKQSYISKVLRLQELTEWKQITHNLDGFRIEFRRNRCKHLCYCHIDPFKLTYDFTKSWLNNINPKTTKQIVINRTPRYRGEKNLDWKILKEYESLCIFIGGQKEYDQFIRETNLKIDYYITKDALEVAEVIMGSKLFIGNQSSCFAISEALKHPRVLEFCDLINNCLPFTSNGKTELTKEYIEYCIR